MKHIVIALTVLAMFSCTKEVVEYKEIYVPIDTSSVTDSTYIQEVELIDYSPWSPHWDYLKVFSDGIYVDIDSMSFRYENHKSFVSQHYKNTLVIRWQGEGTRYEEIYYRSEKLNQ